jgi:hypothetical protein
MRRTLIRTGLLVALCTGCGPGTPTDEEGSAPSEPEWAYGWWMSAGGLQDHPEWGAYILQMEVRPDGTVLQVADYCKGEDWTYESSWELQPNGVVRILPKAGDMSLPFQHWQSSGFERVDLKPTDSSCKIAAVRVFKEDQFEITLERGRWCVGEYRPEFNDCDLILHCGEEPPVCD